MMKAFIQTQTTNAIRSFQTLSGTLLVVSMMAVASLIFSHTTFAATSPIGNLDGAVSCEVIEGWACDADAFSQPLTIHLYDGPAEQGHPLTLGLVADQPREGAISSFCGGTSNHAFRFNIPTSLKDGAVHKIYGYAINTGAEAPNTHLGGSPITVQCGPNTGLLSVEKTADRATVAPGQVITYTTTIKNVGAATTPSVQVIENLQPNLSFVSAGSTAGCAVQGGQVICPLHDYTPGDVQNIVLKYQVAGNIACNSTTVIDSVSDIWGYNASARLGGALAWSNHVKTPVACVAPTVTPTPVITPVATPAPVVVVPAAAVNNGNQISTGNVNVTTGETHVTTGDVKVNVTSGNQTVTVQAAPAPAPKVAAAVYTPVKTVSVPVTAKTGGEMFSLLSILLGGSGLAITRRFIA
jgi:uncharacterized repeat protein (TIGR01451 family)